jgi:6-pyruvoyltetrahydropterin/6-carboxytetrahydropterin synthase
MISIGKIYSFSASHRLPHHEGLCANRHGHNYGLEVQVLGPVDEHSGMVMDFGDLDKIVSPLVEKLDHTHLNDRFPNPTAEELLKWFGVNIASQLSNSIKLGRLKLWETEKCHAEWRVD